MLFTTALTAMAVAAPFVSAHGSGLPRIHGLNPKNMRDLEVLKALESRFASAEEAAHAHSSVKPRQNTQCGPGVGNCPAGQCCSPEGNCGTTIDYCFSPGCQYQYGPACPENQTPAGTDTSTIARPKIGSVPYGGDGVYSCTKPGVIAITYDDGPQVTYTKHILDLLDQYNAKATFFITGNNLGKGEIDKTQEFIDDIKRMDTSGHQVASHTWTHLDLSKINAADRKSQMIKNEMAFRNILGKFPTYMRPPYSSCTGDCETDMATLGYHVIYFDVDTDDYDQDAPNLIQNSKNWFTGNITAGGATAAKGAKWLEISHDIHEQTANNLTEYMLKTLQGYGYKAVTVGECLGDPAANWYRTAGGATGGGGTTTPPTGGNNPVSTDATCGGTNKYTCTGSTFGNCCSANGWCGSTAAYCGTGCQTGFGTCTGSGTGTGGTGGGASSAAPPANTPTPTPASSAPATPTNTGTGTGTGGTGTGGTNPVSSDATCGGAKKQTCTGSTFGNCCSVNGYCGSTAAYCGTGCQAGFGTCTAGGGGTGTGGTTPPALTVSPDASCGGTNKYTCAGSGFGNCCSANGWCGSTAAYCGTGCNKTYGTCT